MTDHDPQRHKGGHGLMMLVCCIPMLVIAGAVAIAGGGWRFLFAAVLCTLMMGAMMGAMSGGDRR
jgi:hypothetical protein